MLARRVSAQHRAVFFRCLATLFESGVTLLASTQLLAGQTDCAPLAAAAQDITLQLSRGHTLSQSMARHPWCFSPMQLALVRVGESSGRLGGVFSRLAQAEERRSALLQRMRSTLMLPILISLVCLALVTVVAPLVLGGVIQQMGLSQQAMPWPTQILILFSTLLRSPWSWALAVPLLVAVGGGLAQLEKSERGRHLRATALDQLPGLGRVIRLYAITHFLQTLETTLEVGFPLLKSLEMSAQAAAHPLLEEVMPEVIEAVRSGVELDRALASFDFFPRLVVQGVKAGQEAGGLNSMLRHLSQLYNVEVEYASQTLSVALEPLVISLVGGLVGFSVVATLLPMTRLVDSL
ncbi:type II secretion system F family protein [bacterium]|nr:type II secretion system F family protein [bacterium]